MRVHIYRQSDPVYAASDAWETPVKGIIANVPKKTFERWQEAEAAWNAAQEEMASTPGWR